MNELALFAGAGGGILGGKLLGFRTVCAVERDAHAAAILAQRQNDGVLDLFPIWSDVETFDGREWKGIIDVVSGGFPCQDISAAGNGDGLEGERSKLWFEMARIISEVQPQYVLVENSPMLTIRGLDRVLYSLASMGFNAEWGVIGAHHIGAIHKRERIWIFAYTVQGGLQRAVQHIRGSGKASFEPPIQDDSLLPVSWSDLLTSDKELRANDGVACWVDRISRIGNGQVPGVVRKAWHVLCQRAAARQGGCMNAKE